MAVALGGELQGRHRRAGATVGSGNKRNNDQEPHVTRSLLALSSRTAMKIIAVADLEPEHDPETACLGLDPGWVPVFGKDHAPPKSTLLAAPGPCSLRSDIREL